MSLKTRHWYKFFANVDCQMTRKNMLCALDIPVGITLNVCKYQIGQSTQRGNGNAKNVKITKHEDYKTVWLKYQEINVASNGQL